ncbi:MAG: hypothetical protein V7638_354 [Acidobacteriota bacterium]|jgi:hypothetical protein
MNQKRKLQVFISSTFADLKEERQAAVEAILTAGHIPAGMELFAAGDESQMNVIKRWIDESDVFLLILGGRYGSVERKTEKSYVQLEYEYAIKTNKPLFAIIMKDDYIEEKVKTHGTKILETINPQKFKEFKALVLSRMVKFWGDPRDIKLAVVETLADFNRRSELVGWIPGTETVDAAALAQELLRLTKENADLREQLLYANVSSARTYNGLTFEEMLGLLLKIPAEPRLLSKDQLEIANEICRSFGDSDVSLLHVFWMFHGLFRDTRYIRYEELNKANIALLLQEYGLVETTKENFESGYYFRLTESGRNFLVRLRISRDTTEADLFVATRF